MEPDPGTYGAIILGVLAASVLSGVFAVQCLIYFRCYSQDRKELKALVMFVWTLEIAHTILIWLAIWDYFVTQFGNGHYVDHIPPTIALSVVLTATLTFLTHCLLAHRIYHLSARNLLLVTPILFLATLRLAAASVSGGEMIYLRSYTRFRWHFRWLFSTGLGLSSAVDILITVSLLFLLQKSKNSSVRLHELIDSLILYTFEIGSLTSFATVISMLCWTLLDNSLIFLGLHFVIGKLYANSLLATLNSRRDFRRARTTAFEHLHLSIIRPATTVVSSIHFEGSSEGGVRSMLATPETSLKKENPSAV